MGGKFKRGVKADSPAAVNDFRLDTYEITVGRFRKFVAAYSRNMIAAGAGRNPNNPADPGWDIEWNKALPESKAALVNAIQCDASYQTWTAADDRLPMNCISWFEAEAFCIWDGGRLPTDAEWNYAAAGGDQHRMYPWGPNAPSADANLAIYHCNYPTAGGTCTGVENIGVVGSAPNGNGRWGHANLAGNVWEWAQDWYDDSDVTPCDDCAQFTISKDGRVIRGGSFDGQSNETSVRSGFRGNTGPSDHSNYLGARCARDP